MSGSETKNPIRSVLRIFPKIRFYSSELTEHKTEQTIKLYFLQESVQWLNNNTLKFY